MMPIHFPYGNSQLYPCPNYGLNYNQYYPSFPPNSNGLFPTPPRALMPPSCSQNINLNIREYRPILANNPSKTRNEMNSNDFLTFIKQKAKPISELNPFANEFSYEKDLKNKHHQIPAKNHEDHSSYKVIFDDLIEQSLQSIEAIKKASKTTSVNHVSTQSDQSIDQINRSTQTTDDNDQFYNQLEEYSSHAITLMKRFDENFKYLLLLTNENSLRNQLKSLNYLCHELRYLISSMNRLIISNPSCSNGENIGQDHFIQSSPMMFDLGERMNELISSSSNPSLSSRQIEPITIVTSKICLLCQKPVDDSNDVMHRLCRLLSSPHDS